MKQNVNIEVGEEPAWVKWEKERKARKSRQNSEKQKRFRERMKEDGFREVKTWEKPIPSGMVKASTLIHKSSLDFDKANPDMWKAFKVALLEIKFSAKQWKDFYTDIKALLLPLGRLS